MMSEDFDGIFKKMIGIFNGIFVRDELEDILDAERVFEGDVEGSIEGDVEGDVEGDDFLPFGHDIAMGVGLTGPVVRFHVSPADLPELMAKLRDVISGGLGKSRHVVSGLEPDPAVLVDGVTGGSFDASGAVLEPFYEVREVDGGVVLVNVDLPGVDACNVKVNVLGTALRIEGASPSRRFMVSIPFDSSLQGKDITWEMNNGMVEVRLTSGDVVPA
ncbi:MAG: Hsp20/alpha crystallin family protein [Promethearchaeota archaeon]